MKKSILVWLIQILTMPTLAQDGYSIRYKGSFETTNNASSAESFTTNNTSKMPVVRFQALSINKSFLPQTTYKAAKTQPSAFKFRISRPNLLVPEVQKVMKFKPLVGFSIGYSF